MTGLLSIVAPIFLLVAVGFAAVRGRLVGADTVQALGAFVLNIALPALILHALIAQDLMRSFNFNYISAYATGSLAVFAIVGLLFAKVLKRPASRSAMAALGGSASNSGFVGFPVASLALGAPALTALLLTMLVEIVVIIPLALALAESARHGQRPLADIVKETVLRLSRMRLIVAIAAGVVMSISGVGPPGPVAAAIGMMADASVPCALFAVGGTLAGLNANSIGGDVLWIVAAKLALHPLAITVSFMLIGGVPVGLMAAGIILAASPMLTVYPIFGGRFGEGGMCAGALLAATAASVGTLLVVLALVLPGSAGLPS